MADELVEAFSKLPTAAISDGMDRLGIPGQPIGVKPLTHTMKLCGRAWTLRYRPIGEVERGTVGDYIDDIEPGTVVVLDNDGRLDATVWGDILTLVAHRQGPRRGRQHSAAGGPGRRAGASRRHRRRRCRRDRGGARLACRGA